MPRVAISRRTLRLSVPVLGAAMVGAIAYAPLYCFPLLAPEFEKAFGTSRTIGRLYDMVDDRYLLLIGTMLTAVGWVFVSTVGDMTILMIAYGSLLAVGLQLVFIGITTAVARRYAGVAGLALGISYAGPGIGVAVALPIAAIAIPEFGWRATTLGFAALSLVALPFCWLMTTGAAVLVPATPPADSPAAHGVGLHETSAPGAIGAAQETVPPGSRSRHNALMSIIKTRRFLILAIGAVGIGCIDEGVFQTSARHLEGQGVEKGFAASLLALQTCAYVVGQIIGGGLSDRFGRRFIGLLCASMIAAGTTAIWVSNGSLLQVAVIGSVVYGFGIGATIAIRSAAFSDVFGGHNFGAIIGVVSIAYPAGGIIVMNAGGILYDRLGNYWPVYWIAMAATLAWSVALLAAGPRRHGLRSRLRSVRERMPV
jgi:MFS family permease